MDEHTEAAAFEVPTCRFDIERFVPARTDTGELELDRWEVCRQTEGVWHDEVLRAFLEEFGSAGTYRVIRYADGFTQMAVFDVTAETRWSLELRDESAAPDVVGDGDS